jgi:hypothetical protein
MRLRIDDGMVEVVEHNITPPMRQAVTIPISDEVAIYVSTSPGSSPRKSTSDEELVGLAKFVASSLRQGLDEDQGGAQGVRSAMKATYGAMVAVNKLHPKPGSQGVFGSYEDYKQTWNKLYYAHQELIELLEK